MAGGISERQSLQLVKRLREVEAARDLRLRSREVKQLDKTFSSRRLAKTKRRRSLCDSAPGKKLLPQLLATDLSARDVIFSPFSYFDPRH